MNTGIAEGVFGLSRAGQGWIRMVAVVLAALVLGLANGAAQAATNPDEAKEFLQTFTDEGLETLMSGQLDEEEKKEKVRTMLSDGFDMDSIAKFVIGPYYRRLEGAKKDEYHQVYFEYVLNTYFIKLTDMGQVDFRITGSAPYGQGDALVNSEVDRKEQEPLRVDWRVQKQQDGSFRVVDIIFEGVSLAVTQRSEFKSVLRSGGVDGLIQALQKKIAKVQSKIQ